MNEWIETTIGDVTENFDSQRVPIRRSNRKTGSYPYYGASGIVDWVDGFIFDGLYLLVAEDGENVRSRNTPLAFLANGKFWVNNHAHVIRGNSLADTRFLCYAIENTDVGGFITGSAQPKLSQSSMNAVRLLLPPLSEQRAIASVLGALDDKIELNRRMNKTLEDMAASIFKAWFVDFEPVHAKAGGAKSFPGTPQEVFDALPSGFVDSELGQIPEGWEIGALGDIGANIRHNIKPDEIDVETPYIGLEHMPRCSIALTEWETVGKVSSGKSRFKKGQILFGKLRPYFHKVGVAPIAGVSSTDILVVEPKKSEWSAFLLGHLSSVDFINHTTACSSGTKMPRTNWKDMASYEVVLPPSEIALALTKLSALSVDAIVENIFESITLAETRDTLLPKLLSGEVRVGCDAVELDGTLI